MKVLALGDCHSRFKEVLSIIDKEQPDTIIQVGDLCEVADLDKYAVKFFREWESKLYYVRGNHDEWDMTFGNVLNGLHIINGRRVVGLSGMYRSKYLSKHNKKYWSAKDLIQLSHLTNVDLFISHEPFYGVGVKKRRKDVGIPILTHVIDYMQPRVALFGHNHKFKLSFYKNTIAISLPPPRKGYGILEYDNVDLVNFYIILKDKKKEIRL